MQTRHRDEARTRRLHEAGQWVLRLGGDDCSEDDMASWLQWCDESPDNLDLFQSLQADWHDLDALKGAPWSKGSSPPVPVQENRWSRWTLAAAIAILFVGGVAMTYWLLGRSQPQQLIAARANKTATLPDGSSVVLAARTLVDVDFTGPKRRLNLSEGLAYFKVQHDEKRPFVVQAGEVNVTAVGTAFDVRRESDRVIVTVEEGVVEVASQARSGTPPIIWRAEAGYQLAYSTREHTATIASIDPSSVLKWRAGEFAYIWEPLATVVADISRYSSRRIVIGDERLAGLRFTGTVFTSSADDWLRAIQEAYPIRVRQDPNGDIVLESSH